MLLGRTVVTDHLRGINNPAEHRVWKQGDEEPLAGSGWSQSSRSQVPPVVAMHTSVSVWSEVAVRVGAVEFSRQPHPYLVAAADHRTRAWAWGLCGRCYPRRWRGCWSPKRCQVAPGDSRQAAAREHDGDKHSVSARDHAARLVGPMSLGRHATRVSERGQCLTDRREGSSTTRRLPVGIVIASRERTRIRITEATHERASLSVRRERVGCRPARQERCAERAVHASCCKVSSPTSSSF